jgi:hypothetical protein
MAASSAMALKSHRKLLELAIEKEDELGFRKNVDCVRALMRNKEHLHGNYERATVPLGTNLKAGLGTSAFARNSSLPLVAAERRGSQAKGASTTEAQFR